MSGKLFKNGIIYVALGFLTPAVNFILLPIYTKYLETEDYALITQSALIQNVLSNLLGFGVNSAFARYFYDYYKDKVQLEKLYSTALISYLLTGLATMFFFTLIGEWLIGVSFKNDVFTFWGYGIFSILIAWFYNMQTVTLSYFRNQEKAMSYAVMSLIFFLSVATCIYIGVVVLDMKAKGSIVGRFIGSFVPVMVYLVWYFLKHKIDYSSILNKKMLAFGLPVVPYLLLNAVLGQVDKFAVERFLDLKLLGLYGFGFLIASVNEIFLNALNSSITPQVFRNLGEGTTISGNKVKILLRFYVNIALLVNIGLTTAGTVGIYYLTDEKFREIAYFFPLLSIAYIPRIFYTIYIIPILYHKKTKVLPAINIITLVVSALTLIGFIPVWGLMGACVARILIQLSQMTAALGFIKRQGLYNNRQMQFGSEYLTAVLFLFGVLFWYILPFAFHYLLLIPLMAGVGLWIFLSLYRNYKSYVAL